MIFVIGTTPQIVTETLYCLIQERTPPIIPDEIHILTTMSGKRKIEEELLNKGRLKGFCEEFGLPFVPIESNQIHLIVDDEGKPLEDIREISHNESAGNFMVNFIREKTEDPSVRLHCSLAGGRKTMSFYLGSSLQLFGRPWDRLYQSYTRSQASNFPSNHWPWLTTTG